MKKQLLAVAVVGALASPAAFAQTVYGIVDVGYQNISDYAPGDVNKDFFTTGQHSSSRLGVRGSEDLAGGTYAMYQIEFDIQADTGATAGSGMTHRLTFVGLGSKSWGELTLGRQLTHVFHTSVVGLSAGTSTFGSAFGQTQRTVRASNSIKYSSPVMGGFAIGALWAPSVADGAAAAEAQAPAADANYYDLAVRYTPGPFGVAVGYGQQSVEAAGVETDNTWTVLGANWDAGPWGVYASYSNLETEAAGATTLDRTVMSISGVFRFGGRNEVHVMFGQGEEDQTGGGANDSTFFGATFVHRMSKRTLVYVGYGDNDNDGAATLKHVQMVPTVTAGSDPKGFQVGLAHSF
jgi:predicted porin